MEEKENNSNQNMHSNSDKWIGDDPLLCKEITKNLCHTMKDEELIDNLIKDSKSNQNLYSMWELAQIFRNQGKMDEYVYWLENIRSSGWQFTEMLRMEKSEQFSPQFLIERLYNEAYVWSEVLLPAYDELGSYLLSKDDVNSIKRAINLFNEIDCYYFDSESKIKEAYKLLEKHEDKTHLYQKISCDFKKEIGQDAWEKLLDNTKIYIHTSEYVLNCLSKINPQEGDKIDFSCVILPLMKALEFELKLIFSHKYLEYLKNSICSSDNYCKINNIMTKNIAQEWPFYKNNTEYFLKISDFYPIEKKFKPQSVAKFTLGNLAYIVGRKKIKDKVYFYDTAIAFCEFLGVEKPIEWLKYITESIDLLIYQRNSSAHAGKIGTIMDVSYCLDRTLLINKLIRHIVLQTV
ncbi:MAG: hypothetical protein ACI4V7_11235 [Succinivibrionaceae bacterium]